MRHRTPPAIRTLTLCVGVLLLVAACTSTTGSQSAATPEDALAYYEQIRAALAADDGSPVPTTAVLLAGTATRAAEEASGDTQAALMDLAAAAEELGALPSSNMRGLRRAFGEVSRAVVGLVVADETLANGRYIFRCPMTMGYKKWVQTSADLENPYMGSRMLHCGSKTRWSK